MFSVGDTIIYSNHGVCKIIGMKDMEYDRKMCPYYVLKPVFESGESTIYAPADIDKSKSKMRRILSAEDVHSLIEAMPDEATIWIENENARKEKYNQILAGDDRSDLIKVIKTLYQLQQELKSKGKKLHAIDEHFMKDAEKALYEEFAHVLNIEPDEVLPYIQEQIELGAAEEAL